MKYKGALLLFFFLSGFSFLGLADGNNVSHKAEVGIPNVALLALQFEDGSDIYFSGETTVAGDEIQLEKSAQSGVWLNYSSVVNNNQKRKVTATVSGIIPEGIILKVKAEDYSGMGKGILVKVMESCI